VALNQKQPLVAAELLQAFRAQRGDAALTERLLLLLNTAYYRAEKPVERRWVMVQLLSRFAKPDYMHDYLGLLMDDRGKVEKVVDDLRQQRDAQKGKWPKEEQARLDAALEELKAFDLVYINVFRLAFANNLLKKGSQYTEFAEKLLNQGSSGEALDVIEAGIANGVIKQPNDTAKSLADQARPLAAEDRKGTSALDKEARAQLNGEKDVKLGLGYVGQKQWEKAVEAISRGLQPERIARVKRVDDSRLLLGYAYFRLGRSGEARAAFVAAGEDARSAELSKLWVAVLDAAAAAAAAVPTAVPPAPTPAPPAPVVAAPAPAKP